MARKPRLEFSEENDPDARDEISRRFCRRWEVAELRAVKWKGLLSRAMESVGKTRKDALKDPKSAKEKVRIARELRLGSTATNGWIAEHLSMGHPTRISNLVRADM